MSKYPWFPMFASDWLGSTKRAVMTLEEQGAYMNLLAHQWGDDQCCLPDDDDVLAALSELRDRWVKGTCNPLRRCFPPHPTREGFVANPKLLKVWANKEEQRRRSSEGGKKSAQLRKEGKGTSSTLDLPLQDPSCETPNQTATSTSIARATTKTTPKATATPNAKGEAPPNGGSPPADGKPAKPKKKSPYTTDFEEWWQHYPKKTGKMAASKAWLLAVQGLALRPEGSRDAAKAKLLEAVQAFAASGWGKAGEFVPKPTDWLANGQYEDDRATWARKEDNGKSATPTRRPGRVGRNTFGEE